MNIHAKQLVVIDFCIYLEKYQQEMYMLMREAYKEEYFVKQMIQYWHKSFSDCRQKVSVLPQKNENVCRESESNILKNNLSWISIISMVTRSTE